MPEIRIEEIRGRGMILIRAVEGADVASAARVGAPGVRRIESAGDRRLAWMSPDERLLFLPAEEVTEAVAALEAALADRPSLVVDVSDARAQFRLVGDGAREVLAKGAPVDLARGAFGPGDFRRTRLGQVAAAFGQVDETPETFELVCFRSVASHVRGWLDAASAPGSLPGVL